MNERIRELAEQCNFTEEDIKTLSPGFEKFAQLIVQDCVDIIQQNIHGPCGRYDYSYTDEKFAQDQRAETILEEVKYRFGVK